MQSPALPIQLTSPAPAPTNAGSGARKSSGAVDGAPQFSAALSREMGQRSSAPAPAAPVKPAAQAPKAAAPKQADKHDQPAQADQDAPDTATPAPPAGTAQSADASAKADSSAADAAAQAAANPMFDLMALVASFNQPLAAAPVVAASAAAAATTTAAAADPAASLGQAGLGALPPEISAQLPLAAAARLAGQAVPAAPVAPVTSGAAPAPASALEGTFANMMGKVDGAMQEGLEAAAAKLAMPSSASVAPSLPRARALATDGGATDQKPAAPAAAVTGAPVQLAATVQRDAPAELPVLKEAPVAAVAPTPLQQAAFAPLQGAAAAHGAERIAARVGTPAWDNQVAQKVVWMVAGKEQSATLTLNPPDMGPMQVVLSVNNDQASVTFSSAQPEVRQALLDAMPKLREMMGESGIALGNASVHDGSTGQQQAQQGEPGRSGAAPGHGDHGRTASGSAAEAQARVDARPLRPGETPGLVDTFA
jgi:flagellar hook-length control protein FliK